MNQLPILMLCLVVFSGCQNTTEEQDLPNIIFIMVDDRGRGDVQYNDQSKIKTPNIDRHAERGLVFNQHYAGSTVCMPSRYSLLPVKH